MINSDTASTPPDPNTANGRPDGKLREHASAIRKLEVLAKVIVSLLQLLLGKLV